MNNKWTVIVSAHRRWWYDVRLKSLNFIDHWWPPGHRSCSLVVLSVHQWHLNSYWVWNDFLLMTVFAIVKLRVKKTQWNVRGVLINCELGCWARKWGMYTCDSNLSNAIWCSWQKRIKKIHRGARWLSGRVSDSGARGQGFETYRLRVVSLSKTLYSPKVLVNYPGSGGSVPTWLKNCWLGR